MRYTSQMTTTGEYSPFMIPVDDEHADMLAYARGPEGRANIARAQAEVDKGLGILADDAYFEKLKERRAQRKAVL